MNGRFGLVANRAPATLLGAEFIIGFDSNAVFITKARTLGVVAFLLTVLLRPVLVVASGAFFAHALIAVAGSRVLIELSEAFQLLALAAKAIARWLIPRATAIAVIVSNDILEGFALHPTKIAPVAWGHPRFLSASALAIASGNRGFSLHLSTLHGSERLLCHIYCMTIKE